MNTEPTPASTEKHIIKCKHCDYVSTDPDSAILHVQMYHKAPTDGASVTPETDEARKIAKRFIDHFFGNKGQIPHVSIPADPNCDDDIRLHAFIDWAEAQAKQLSEARREVERLKPCYTQLSTLLELWENHVPFDDCTEEDCAICAARAAVALYEQKPRPDLAPTVKDSLDVARYKYVKCHECHGIGGDSDSDEMGGTVSWECKTCGGAGVIRSTLPPVSEDGGEWIKSAADAIWGGVITEGLTKEEIEGIIRISIPKQQPVTQCDIQNAQATVEGWLARDGAEQQAGDSDAILRAALQTLIDHPYPHDLIATRMEIESKYQDEDEARDSMETYCTEEFMETELAKHKWAVTAAKQVLDKSEPAAPSASGGTSTK